MPITRTYYKVHRCFPDPDYFYLENISGSSTSFTIGKTGTPASTDLAYSFDKVTWTDIHNGGTISNVANGAKVYFRSSTGLSYSDNYFKFHITSNFNAGGHIATLFNYTNTSAITSIPDAGLNSLFSNSYIVHANIDFYGIKSIGKRGCFNVFSGCRNLVSIPDFSSIEALDDFSFWDTFQDCSLLNTPADLTNVTSYKDTSLAGMYDGSSSLTEAIAPNVSTWINGNSWLADVAATGVVRKPAGLEIPTGTSGVPSGWTTVDY